MNPEAQVRADAVEDEISALVAALDQTERRLEEPTRGEVDSVVNGSGRPFLLRRAQEDLRHSDATKQAAILNALPAHIALLDAQGVIVAVNETWRQFAQANLLQVPEAAVGVNYLDVCERAHGAEAGEARHVADGIRLVLAGATSFSLEYPCHGPLEQRWFLLTVTPLTRTRTGGAVVMHLNITARKQAAEALRVSEAEFRTLAEAMPQMVWATRPDGWNIYFNQQWMSYTGLTLEESVGEGWSRPFHPDDRERARAAWSRATSTLGKYALECRLRRADGVYRWWLIQAVPMRDAAGQTLKWIGTCTDINDLKLAELKISQANETLRVTAEKYRAIFENSCEGIFQNTIDGQIISANPALARILGFASADELIRERTDVARQGYADPAWRERFQRLLAERGFINGLEYQVRRRDGALIWVSENTRLVRATGGHAAYYEGSLQDITERKTAQDALQASERRFRAVFEQAAVGVAQADAVTGKFVEVNQRFADLVGRTKEELVQLTFREITHPLDVERDREIMGRLRAGTIREFSWEKRYQRKDATEVWVNLTVSAMWATGEPPGLTIAVVQDITERKRLDQHFLQAQKMEALGQFSGGVAHDFNNILAAISGYTELARMQLKDRPEVGEHLGAVLRATGRAADLVRQILTFSRQQPQERRSIQLQPILAESLKLMRATIPATIEFDAVIAADAPTVLANANQVHQVLMNLGVNAWHAMKDGPGRLRVRLERFVVDAALAAAQPRLRPGVYARIAVGDTGCGIDAVTLRRIFEPFFTTKPPGEGTGLGLAVVDGIMESHDGATLVASQPGEGTTFELYFPAHTAVVNVAVLDSSHAPRGRGERVLVVDDEELLAQLFQASLNALGYVAEIATRPADALARVRSEPQRFALVLSDQSMPGMTGLALAGELTQLRFGLPVILITGYSASLTPDRLRAAGVDQLLHKPITIQALGVAVHATLAARRSL